MNRYRARGTMEACASAAHATHRARRPCAAPPQRTNTYATAARPTATTRERLSHSSCAGAICRRDVARTYPCTLAKHVGPRRGPPRIEILAERGVRSGKMAETCDMRLTGPAERQARSYSRTRTWRNEHDPTSLEWRLENQRAARPETTKGEAVARKSRRGNRAGPYNLLPLDQTALQTTVDCIRDHDPSQVGRTPSS